MEWILLISLLLPISAALDPCEHCPIPEDFTEQDYVNCGREPNSGSEYAPTFIRYPLGSECYLQMMDCPGYDVVTSSFCTSMARPEQALRCIAGRFYSSTGIPIEGIHCNNGSDTSSLLFTPTSDESACGSAGSTTQAVQMTTSYSGPHCVLTLSGCDSYNVVSGYDGTGICRTEENVVAVSENGMFKLNNRYIYQVRCANSDSLQTSCNGLGWNYNWVTDNYFKVGFHKTYNEAKAECLAVGGQLASIHNDDERSFILVLAMFSTSNPETRFNIWLGIESDGNDSWVNVDGTPFDYSPWAPTNPSGDGACVRMSTNSDVGSGPWYNVPCSIETAAYACRKRGPCAFKEMLEEWRFQSCFNGGSLKFGETLEIYGVAPLATPDGYWSISLVALTNAPALIILISNWGSGQPKVTIASPLNGFADIVTYDCPFKPGAEYIFQAMNMADGLLLAFDEVVIQHNHTVSNPANGYWGIAIIIEETIPKIQRAVVHSGGSSNDLGLGDLE